MSEHDLSFVDEAVARIGRTPDAVIPILQAIQDHYQYLPEESLQRVCELTQITPATITGVSTFYTRFRHRPIGKHRIQVCRGTACHVKGADLVHDAFAHQLHLAPGEDTDAAGEYTLEPVACLGCCTLAPVVQIDDATYGRLTPQGVPGVLREFEHRRPVKHRATVASDGESQSTAEIRIGLGSCCVAQGSDNVYDTLTELVARSGVDAHIKRVGCVGMCHQTPLMEMVHPDGTTQLYSHVQAEHVEELVLRHFRPRGLLRRLRHGASKLLDRLYSSGEEPEIPCEALKPKEGPVCEFLGPQQRIATEFCGDIDPLDLDEYRRHRGFTAIQKCLDQYTPEEVIEQIRISGLRGRGGAGFPTHVKWSMVRSSGSEEKYLICNGDEGDPGAFMDRMLLESFPYRVIEGMAIAAYAVGARRGIFYIRAEYPLALDRIRESIHRCNDRGLLKGTGKDGKRFEFELTIKEGAGAFICGEETALIHSIEGERGTPRLRPPYPAESGLWNRPTLINNVETLTLVPWIIRQGGEAFAAMGTEKSKGTKVFALAGKVQRGGLIEVPMGVTLREIVEQIGGGANAGRRFKAVQVGGPSGGCVPANLAHTPVDYEALTAVGAIMGSGGLVVLDDSDCMVDIARYFLRFTQDQSCGKCTFCRVGTKRMLDILDRICGGAARKGDLDELESLSRMVTAGSLCGLGKTAPNPVLSTLRYFRHEYEAHLDGVCPAGRCKDLIAYEITDRCIGCTLCSQQCPVNAIPLTPYRRHVIETEKCTNCDTCLQVCPEDAVQIVSRKGRVAVVAPQPVPAVADQAAFSV
jgi:NADH-quinone oxidoreductase subunit F